MRFVSGDYRIDTDRMEIHGPDGPVRVEPQVFDVVALLVTNRHRVVGKAELLDAVWGSRFVSESTLTSRIKSARQAIGDDGRRQAVIRTVHGRGYQWVAPVEADADPAAAPAAGRVRVPVAQPPLLDSLFGRDGDLAGLRALLSDARLVTVVGPGGVGKTRLVLELLQGRDSAVLVELATVEEPEAVGEAVATVLGVQTGQRADTVTACAEYLAGTQLLLVVDNCEHVRDSAGAFLGSLAARCPQLRLLTTSRVPLGLPGEQVFPLGPLRLAEEDAPLADVEHSPAVALFVARARRAAATFPLDEETVRRIDGLCRALDGLPLAIEFAASRSAALGLTGVAERLDRRLDLLATDHSGSPARHASLRATIEWSYELLDSEAQWLFRQLCVFPGGVRLATVDQIATGEHRGDPAAVVARLVHTSMLIRADRPSGARFTPLETVRAFGLEQLCAHDEEERAHEAMVQWALALVAELETSVAGVAEPFWNDLVRQELANLRAVRRYLADRGRLVELVSLLRGLTDWAEFRDIAEFWRWQRDLAAQCRDAPDELRLPALVMEAFACWLSGRLDLAQQPAQEVYDRATTGWLRAHALDMLANVDLFAGRFQAAARRWLERLAIEECPQYQPSSRALAALALGYAGEFDRARALAAESRAEAARLGWPSATARAYYVSGEVEHVAGAGREHEAWLERAVEIAEAAGATFLAGIATVTLASSRARAGDTAAAAALYRRLIGYWLRTGTWTQQWTTLRNAADLLAGHDDACAVRIWAAANADPQAARLSADAAARASRLRADVVMRLGQARVRELEAQAAATPRLGVAEEAARALSRLAAGHQPCAGEAGGTAAAPRR